jgi:hypothetical protein
MKKGIVASYLRCYAETVKKQKHLLSIPGIIKVPEATGKLVLFFMRA